MSIVITTDVFCDGEGCSLWEFGVTGPKTRAVDARNVAKRRGWKRLRDGRDLCPDCAAKNLPQNRSSK